MKDRVKTCPTHLIWGVPCNNCPKFDLNELKYCQFKNYLTKYQNTKASYPYPIKVLYNFRLLNIKHDQRKSSPSLKAEQFNDRVSHFGTFFSDSLATSPSMVHWSKQHAEFLQDFQRSSTLPGWFSDFVLNFTIENVLKNMEKSNTSNHQTNRFAACIMILGP